MRLDIDYLLHKDNLIIKKEGATTKILDPIRKKLLVLTPEEFVRQLLIQYLIKEKSFNEHRIGIEKKVVFNKMPKRCDVLIYDKNMDPFMLVECKSAEVKVNQSTFEQIARYNYPLKVPYLLVTNGLATYCCKIDYNIEHFEFLSEIPSYPE